MKKFFLFRISKKAAAQEDRENSREKFVNHSSGRQGTILGKADVVESRNGTVEKEREKLKSKSRRNTAADPRIVLGDAERKRETQQNQIEPPNPRLSNPPRHLEGEQVAAGWPAWLSAEAGEALKGWIPRRADSFEKLDKIGQGTYSNVYKARDLDTGKVVALKKVRFDNMEPESVRFMAREIQILRHLNHPNVIKLEGLVTSRMSCSLYLVFEYMEHDLAGLAACPGISFTESQVKCYMQQILRGLDHCHSRGVLHRDIKGSNLLLDNGGILKMADFGLATTFHPDQKHALTSRVVTLWYRPPELLLGATDYGVGVDLWSVGCILAELLAGRPIMPGRTEVEQLHKIFKLCGSPSEEYWKKSKLPHATIFKPQQPYKRCIAETFRDFSSPSLALLDILLAIEPMDRGTSASALQSEFFTAKPLACDPSSLPKYPPSKEFDARIRDEEARRQRAAGGRIHGQEAARKLGSREHSTRAVPVPEANAELVASLQKHQTTTSHGAAKSRSEKFNPEQDDTAVGFPFDPPQPLDGGDGGRVHVPTSSATLSGPQPITNVTDPDGSYQVLDDMVPGHVSQPAKSVYEIKVQSGHGLRPSSNLSSLSALVAARNNAAQIQKDSNATRLEMPYEAEGSQNIRQKNTTDYVKQGRTEILGVNALSRDVDVCHLQEPTHRDRPVTMRFGPHPDRVHFSGPLLPPSANLDNILGEHERHIQQAVRRARYDKGKNQRNGLKNWGNAIASELRTSQGPTFGHMRTAKAHFTGEIIELREPEPGLSSVLEH